MTVQEPGSCEAGDGQGSACLHPAVNDGNPSDDDPLFLLDEFRMYCYKVLPCAKRFCHDWSTCPFAHFSERAKRRDLRAVRYTAIACPEMKKGDECPRGEKCPYAHNVFEYWLHPTRYRTRMCRDGTSCTRKVCFFAHKADELRVPPCKPSLPVADDPWPFGSEDPAVSGVVDAASLKMNKNQSGHRRTFSVPHELLAGLQAEQADSLQGATVPPARTYSIPPHMSQAFSSGVPSMGSGDINTTALFENLLKSVGNSVAAGQRTTAEMTSTAVPAEQLVCAMLANLGLTSSGEVQQGSPHAVNLQLLPFLSQPQPQYVVSSHAMASSQQLPELGSSVPIEASMGLSGFSNGHPLEVMQRNPQNDDLVHAVTAPVQNAELLRGVPRNSLGTVPMLEAGGDAIDDIMRAFMALQTSEVNPITTESAISLQNSLNAIIPENEASGLEMVGNESSYPVGMTSLKSVLG